MESKDLQAAIDAVAKEYGRVVGMPTANAVNPYDGNCTAARAKERLGKALDNLEAAAEWLRPLPLPVVEPKTAKPRAKAKK